MITVYNTNTGVPINLVHPIDAKEAIGSGQYTYNKPVEPKAEPKKGVAPKSVVVEKPVVKEEVIPEEVKKEVVIEPKPVRKIVRQ